MRFLFITIVLFSLFSEIYAQTNDWRSYLERLAENDEVDAMTLENMYEELSFIEENPMDLNNIPFDQLERFPLLSGEQISSVIHFLEKNRPLYSVFELRNVYSLDFKTVELILPFFCVSQYRPRTKRYTLAQMIKLGAKELQLRFDKTLNKRAGYENPPDDIQDKHPNRKYIGEDFYTSLAFRYSFGDKIKMGINAEKDAGEPFLKSGYRKGYDFYAVHFLIRDVGVLKQLNIGDFRLSFGQGLVLNNDFMISKVWAMNDIARRTALPKAHRSMSENDFFRGIASVFQIDKVNITAFYSNKLFDANLSADGGITSFKTDGYHRLQRDMNKKNNSREQLVGLNVNYRNKNFQIGVTSIFYKYNRNLEPQPRGYNAYYLRGDNNANAGMDYSYRFNRIFFAGETAISRNGSIATINMIKYSPSERLSLSVLYRHFPVSYQALHAKAFSSGANVRNESAFFVGATIVPFDKLTTTSYIDFIRYPWPKYDVDIPSKAIDACLLVNYAFSRTSNLEFRAKIRNKDKNIRLKDERASIIRSVNIQNYGLKYSKTLYSGWSFKTTLNLAFYVHGERVNEKGYMISQNIGYLGNKKLNLDIFVGYFNSDSFNTRLYSYERNILNTFYMPSFHGEGVRVALSGRYNILPNLSLSLKIGHSRYFKRASVINDTADFNQNIIGSGTEQIKGNNRTDIYTYLRWVF